MFRLDLLASATVSSRLQPGLLIRMLRGMIDDIQYWYNYTPQPSAAETRRLEGITGNAIAAQALSDFGIRPLSALDLAPETPPHGVLDKPFEVLDEHLSDQDILVDIGTGFRFRYLPDKRRLAFDLLASSNQIDTVELLTVAAQDEEFVFERVKRATYLGGRVIEVDHILPLSLRVSTYPELRDTLDRLTDLFCKRCPRTKKLWLRGQCTEYAFKRSEEFCQMMYGVRQPFSLLPSAGRYAFANPDKMGFGISFGGPSHYWKKPFLIWIMRENAPWFERDRRALDVLSNVLANDDEEEFIKMLGAIKWSGAGPMFADLSGGVAWPEEADDLRQWFFAHMKTHSLGITLQQYGYVTTLLDLTEDLDVAVYFTQAEMHDRKIRKIQPKPGRLIYVFAERSSGDFFRHGNKLFWGDEDWAKILPPRLKLQKAGFIMGSTCRAHNFYGNMVVARIFIEGDGLQSSLRDEDLFPSRQDDLLFSTLLDSRPAVEGLY